MKTDKIKCYAPQARTDCISAVIKQVGKYGIPEQEILPVENKGDVALIGDRPFP